MKKSVDRERSKCAIAFIAGSALLCALVFIKEPASAQDKDADSPMLRGVGPGPGGVARGARSTNSTSQAGTPTSVPPASGSAVSGPTGAGSQPLTTGDLSSSFPDSDAPGGSGGDTDTITLHGLNTAKESAAERMEFNAPSLKALITVTSNLDPFQLDAGSSRSVTLQQVLQEAINQNLDLGIRNQDVSARKWTLGSSYGNFLPNLKLDYRWQYLKGILNLPFFGSDNVRINTPFIISQAGYEWYLFRGGKNLYTAIQNRNYLRAARHQRNASINDVLLEATRRYYNLMLSEAQLQIRIKAVKTSEDQLKLDQDLLEGGRATMLDVLQAKTQLAADRQALIDQQISRRNAAIELAEYLNLDQNVDLVPQKRVIQRARLIQESVRPADLLASAVKNRPELKQFEELRLAAKRGINLAAAPLLPTFRQFGTIYGIGETLSNAHDISNNPIPVQSPFGGNTAANVGPHPVSKQIKALYAIGYEAQWNVNGLGLTDAAAVVSAKHQARQAALQAIQELNAVTRQVRESYLNSLSTNRKIEETTARVESSLEELRLAQLRFQNGVGRNIDVVKAQQDYTSALIDNSQALTNFNIAQAQLLHDLGVISTANLTANVPLASP